MMDSSSENEEKRETRMAWWREAKFGMFIHWGIYSILAGMWRGKCIPGIGEWIQYRARIPVKEYEALAKHFNPQGFDAKEWVRIAKEAGMKWIVITAKHHDGFCMFETELTDYNIVDATPFGRDPLKELAEACAGEDIKLGFYYSQTLDWHHPNGMGNDWDFDPSKQNFTSFLRKYVKPQIHELLTSYGPVAVIWFDIGTPTPELALELKNHVRELQSDTIICGRIRGGIRPRGPRRGVGDYTVMGDNEIPNEKIEDDWETPATINDTWGYKSYDHNWKSSGDLIKKLVDIVSKGGNYLLNVGPTREGLIPEPSIKRLRNVGDWLRVNDESIYGAKSSPIKFHQTAPYRCTSRPGKIYIHIFGWPWNSKLNVIGIAETVRQAYLLANKERLDVEQKNNIIKINLPEKAPDPIDTVLVLDYY